MEFRKIDDTKFQCRLLEEDLENNNISLDDFFRNDTAKIHGLLDTVMEEAKESIGVDLDGSVMSLQLAPQPDHSILLTISSGKDDFKSMLKQANIDESDIETYRPGSNIVKNGLDAKKADFKSFDKIADIFKQMEDEIEEDDEKDQGEIAKADETESNLLDAINDALEDKAKAKESKDVKVLKSKHSDVKFLVGVFAFNSLEEFEEMCSKISKTWGVTNSLWKNDDKYYLVIKRARASKEKYVQLLNTVVEYGRFDWAGEERVAYVTEHFTPIIKSNAINTVKRYL